MTNLIMVLALSLTPALADRFDLQFALKGSEQEIRDALKLKKRHSEEREIYLFDTADLFLFENSIQIRLRLHPGYAELGVKRWNLDRKSFTRLQEIYDDSCETDIHGDLAVLSCTVKKRISLAEAEALIAEGDSLLDRLSRKQLELLMEEGSPPRSVMSTLVPLGPIDSRAWTWRESGGRKFSVDIQTLPNERRFVELSVKTEDARVARLQKQMLSEFRSNGLKLSENQSGRRPQKLRQLLGCSELLTNHR